MSENRIEGFVKFKQWNLLYIIEGKERDVLVIEALCIMTILFPNRFANPAVRFSWIIEIMQVEILSQKREFFVGYHLRRYGVNLKRT
ncbi:hypothetical protein AB3N59_02875 [Leptospira sp. WS92.C1]